MERRLLELLGMLMIGDGLLSIAEPRRHCLLWDVGPKPWRKLATKGVEHPDITRGFGLLELILGLWLASRQTTTTLDR